MPTQITQRESNGRTYLRVEGEMLADDAELLERIAAEILDETSAEVRIDLADLDFLDSDSASVLRRLDSTAGISIEGLQLEG